MLIRLRYWTALLIVGGLALGLSPGDDPQDPAKGDRLAGPSDTATTGGAARQPTGASDLATAEEPDWHGTVGPGDSLSGMLAQAGLGTAAIGEVTTALGSAFDLQRLQPGHGLALTLTDEGQPDRVTLEIEDGSRIQATFGATATVRTLAPQLHGVRRAGEAVVDGTIFGALEAAGMPTRFATDLELILAELVDLRSGVTGGEHLRIMWREMRSGARVVGDPVIDFAQLDLAQGRYEILWPDDTARQTRVLRDGVPVRTFTQPVAGARLSSAFGPRLHPVHGTVRMHSGVDFATAEGDTVVATQAGRVLFAGTRSGYGTVVELDHGDGVQTRYAHLSAVDPALVVGGPVAAGTALGRAGSTGTSTAPHLHYEIRVDGTPVSPLADRRLQAIGGTPVADEVPARVADMLGELDRLLAARG